MPYTLSKTSDDLLPTEVSGSEISENRWTLNFGPQHPATHTTLRLVLELDGERIVKVTPHIGYLHSGFEKCMENLNYNQNVTIVDRMDEIDCSDGGTIRAANMAFRSERIVILHKLIDLQRAGCDVEVVLSNADGDIMTGLVLAGIPVHPFFLRAAAPRPQVIVHDKFWLVDARSVASGDHDASRHARPDNQINLTRAPARALNS